MTDSVIYHGRMGTAGYQRVINRMLPLRGLGDRFDSMKARMMLAAVKFLQPRLRAWVRNHRILIGPCSPPQPMPEHPSNEFSIRPQPGQDREFFLKFLIGKRWRAGGDTDDWDLEKNGTRLQIAMEYRGDGLPTILFRVWGNADQLKRYMSIERSSR
jgi:hypothetical protein